MPPRLGARAAGKGSTLPAAAAAPPVRRGGGVDGIGGGVGGGVLIRRCSGILLVLELALNDLGLHRQQRRRWCPRPALFQYPFGP